MSGVLIPTATEAEWLEARRSGITASEIPVVLGLSNWSSPYKLYHQKTGVLPPDDMTAVQERGHVLEPYIAAKFAQRHPEFHVHGDGRTLYAHPDRPWQRATPDRLVCEAGNCSGCLPNGALLAGLECKSDASPGDEWGDDGSDEIPVHYRAQVLWNMDVQQVTTWYLACLFVQSWQVRVYEITMDDAAAADLKLMREEARVFLDRIDLGDPPDVDWRPATRDALNGLHPGLDDTEVTIGRRLAISYRAAIRRFKEAERRKDEMTNRVLAALGDGRHAIEAGTGRKLATRSVSYPRRIDTKQLRARHPAVAAECTKPPKPEPRLTAASGTEAAK